MPMSEEYVRKLQFPQMVAENSDNHETAFTVSVDHISTTTGISAAERSVTAMKCVDENANPKISDAPDICFHFWRRRTVFWKETDIQRQL